MTRDSSIVDAHVHLFRAWSSGYPRVVVDIFPRSSEARAEDLLAAMAEGGVSKAVIVALSGHYRYLGECLERWPAVFSGIGVVEDSDPDPAGSFVSWRDRIGMAGMRTNRIREPGEAEPTGRLADLLAALAEGGHPLWFYGDSDQLAGISLIAQRYPSLPIVLNHLGFCPTNVGVDELGRRRIETALPPPTLSTVLGLASHPNVYVMFSGQYAFSSEPFPHRDTNSTVTAIHEAFGAARMMWATDYPASIPFAGYPEQLSLVDVHLPDLSGPDRARLIGGTTSEVLGLSPIEPTD